MINDPFPTSPVPSDSDLPPGRLPFTAFGQFGVGNLDYRVFEQDTYWVNNQGEPFLIEEMSRSHLMNVLKGLMENAELFHEHGKRVAEIELIETPLLHGHESAIAMEQALGISIFDVTAAQWLRSTPLARKLLACARAAK